MALPQQTPKTIQGYDKKVVMDAPQMESFQNYQDAALAQARRGLDPQQDAQRKRFEQQMINKGLDPASAAFQSQHGNMTRAMNDQDIAAQFGAMQFGQQAQQQAYAQALGASQLAQGMSRAEMADATQRRGQDFSRAAQQDQIGLNYAQLGQAGDQFQDQFAFNQDKWADQYGLQRDQFGFQQDQADFGNMMNMGQFALGYGNYLNNAAQTDYNMAAAMLSNAPGNQQQQLNVGGAYNTAQQGAMNQANLNQNAAQMMWSGVGDLAGAAMFLSSVDYKTVKREVKDSQRGRVVGMLATMPIYEWEYLPEFQDKNDVAQRFGPLAEDFNKMLGKSKVAQELDHIDVQRYVSGLHMCVQDLFGEVRRLEGLVWYIANRNGECLDMDYHVRRKHAFGAKKNIRNGMKSSEMVGEFEKDPGLWMQEDEIKARMGSAIVRRQ